MTSEFIRKYFIYQLLLGTNETHCISRTEIATALKNRYIDYHEGDKLYEGLLVTSEKTIKRDIESIESFFGVDIKHKRNHGHYMLKSTEVSETHRAIFDKMELFLASHKEKQWSPFISTEKSSLNTDIDILALVKAIEHNLYIKICYKGWYDDDLFTEIKKATVQPLHIKECNRAWYLLVHNKNIGIKVLCLDQRVSKLDITAVKVEAPLNFDVKDYFKHAFGILNDTTKVETVRLKVANHHFKYLESKPLHPSQNIISYPEKHDTTALNYTDDAIFGEIEVTLKPNFEFLIELFKFNLWVKVVQPHWLAQKMVKQHRFILNHYYSDIEVSTNY